MSLVQDRIQTSCHMSLDRIQKLLGIYMLLQLATLQQLFIYSLKEVS